MTVVSAVLTSFNRAYQLEGCLWMLCHASTVKPDEICIVDDGSTDETSGMFASVSQINGVPLKFMRRERTGGWSSPARPRNMAIRMTRSDADYLWFLEPEQLVMPDTLARMLAWFASRPGESIWVNATQQAFMQRHLSVEEQRHPEEVWTTVREMYRDPNPHLAVRCALVPRAAVYAIRGCDEGFVGWGHDDTSFMARLEMVQCHAVNDFSLRIIHQMHGMAPANAVTADNNLARLQEQQRAGVYAPNDETWGTSDGQYPWLAESR